jgi:hypothetical protein
MPAAAASKFIVFTVAANMRRNNRRARARAAPALPVGTQLSIYGDLWLPKSAHDAAIAPRWREFVSQ